MHYFGLPHSDFFKYPSTSLGPPSAPFENALLAAVFDASMKVSMPLTIAIVYFSVVHFVNPLVIARQKKKAHLENEKLTETQLKRLAPAPFPIAKSPLFKLFVLLHNVFLCVYSVWTFVSMLQCFGKTVASMSLRYNSQSRLSNFVYAVCDVENGVFNQDFMTKNLTILGWWFYMSKFYEVIDTIIILLKGKPSSLLQSYHHAGAMMLRVPVIAKRILTSLQICQFVFGGSLAVFHAFVWYYDTSSNSYNNCIHNAEQAMPLMINVAYLTPLTMLFAAFYIESYIKGGKK
ncbi:hypothetical protein SBP28_004772 [Candidozyma auris]|nr:hypothetical protein CJJ09_004977 [[Candida] auris]